MTGIFSKHVQDVENLPCAACANVCGKCCKIAMRGMCNKMYDGSLSEFAMRGMCKTDFAHGAHAAHGTSLNPLLKEFSQPSKLSCVTDRENAMRSMCSMRSMCRPDFRGSEPRVGKKTTEENREEPMTTRTKPKQRGPGRPRKNNTGATFCLPRETVAELDAYVRSLPPDERFGAKSRLVENAVAVTLKMWREDQRAKKGGRRA